MSSVFDIINRKILEASGLKLMPEETAVALLGLVIERGKDFFLNTMQKEGFSKDVLEQELRKLTMCINEEFLFKDPHFSFSLYLGSLTAIDRTAKALHRELTSGEGIAAIKIALDEIFPPTLSLKLLGYLVTTNHQLFFSLTNEKLKEMLREHRERQRKLFPAPPAEIKPRFANMGTDTWLVTCPMCDLEKRCDAKTKRFKCKKCGFEKPYGDKNTLFRIK